MIWKSLGVLLGAVTLIILGVVGLARVTVPDEPNFAEGLEEGGTDADTFLETLPIAVGGQLELSGAKEGTVVVDQNVNGPSYGLGNSKTRIFFEGSPLSVSQMSHDGLTFFRVDPGFVIQGGDPTGTGTAAPSGGPGYSIPDEDDPGHLMDEGVISMAKAGPNTTGSQFFITIGLGTSGDLNYLDAGFTVFGEVMEGLDVAKQIVVDDIMESVTIEEQDAS